MTESRNRRRCWTITGSFDLLGFGLVQKASAPDGAMEGNLLRSTTDWRARLVSAVYMLPSTP
jgi:hypothetical protein